MPHPSSPSPSLLSLCLLLSVISQLFNSKLMISLITHRGQQAPSFNQSSVSLNTFFFHNRSKPQPNLSLPICILPCIFLIHKNSEVPYIQLYCPGHRERRRTRNKKQYKLILLKNGRWKMAGTKVKRMIMQIFPGIYGSLILQDLTWLIVVITLLLLPTHSSPPPPLVWWRAAAPAPTQKALLHMGSCFLTKTVGFTTTATITVISNSLFMPGRGPTCLRTRT